MWHIHAIIKYHKTYVERFLEQSTAGRGLTEAWRTADKGNSASSFCYVREVVEDRSKWLQNGIQVFGTNSLSISPQKLDAV